MSRAAALTLAALLAAPADAQQVVETQTGTGAVLRGLDRISGHVEDVTLPSGGQVSLGTLEVSLRECRFPADDPAGNAFAFLVIRERGRTDPLFSGWMVAASPALNPLDHSRYDVWVMRCTTS